jgi:hypothetical protein
LKSALKINAALITILLLLFLSACGNDGVYNEETNREAIKRKKAKKDSMIRAEQERKDSINFQK